MRCEQLAEVLPEAADGTPIADELASNHLAHCLRCQATLAQYRRLRRGLAALRGAPLACPVDLLDDVLDGLDGGGRERGRAARRVRRAALFGGLAAATAAGAAGAIVFSSRSRRTA